ncbi:MAG: ShlB/FhaC/HecB family hemolysin secretion/activation protein [Desulfococcaceae bacterium]
MKRNLFFYFSCLVLISCSTSFAQDPNPSPFSQFPSEERPALPEFLPESPEKGLELPPVPEGKTRQPGRFSFELKGIDLEGNTVFSDENLTEVAESFIGKQVTLADLEEIRYRITRRYVDAGYVNSGAVLKPDQRVENGRVTYLVIEGRLDEISITGAGRLRPRYVQNRLRSDPERPFNTQELQERFQLLLQDPLIDRMNGSIRPGMEPGEAMLDLEVTRSRPYALRLIADNHRPPSTGAERITAAGSVWNLTGFGDRLDASFGISEGADEWAAAFTIPLNAMDTRLSLRYLKSDSSVIEEPLDDVDIESETETGEIQLMHPILRNLRRSFEVGATLAVRESKTWLLDEPFSFTEGAENGKSQVTALRLIGSFVDRTSETALALRSTFNFGLDLFGATQHGGDRPDGQFFSWLGQAQYARRISPRLGQLIFRGDIQIAEDELLTLERIAVGGVHTVRGYRENELVRDSGYILSLEWRYPLFRQLTGGGHEHLLQIAPFMDFGAAWNKGESIHEDCLHSVGVGLLWSFSPWANAELYWGHDLESASDPEDYDLQDDGIHFLVSIDLF